MQLLLLKHLLFFIGVFAFGYIIFTILLKFSKNLGIRNTDETLLRWSTEQKPALGGIGFYIVFLISVASYFLVFNNSLLEINIQLRGLIIACSLAFLMGLADDAYNTKPLLKLATQIICSLILIYHQLYVQIFDDIWLNYFFTIFWVVGLMNSLNMLDNMDGITASVTITICLNLLAIDIFIHPSFSVFSIILIGLIGILLSFLIFNRYPSKIFMGDTGSQFLGIIIAGLSILYMMKSNQNNSNTSLFSTFLIIFSAFLIPLTDTTSVFINRLKKGNSPFVGGKDHTTHNLSYKGFSDNHVALIFLSISFIGNLLSFLLNFFKQALITEITIITSVYCLLVFLYLFSLSIKEKRL